MKIAVAQVASSKGDIIENVKRHVSVSRIAASKGAKLVVFSELSLTGYEPALANELATSLEDLRLNSLQTISDTADLMICAGLPIRSKDAPRIGMVILQPQAPRQLYCKRHLHSDELPYFTSGGEDVLIHLNGLKIAPAICYESLLLEHSEQAAKCGANLYLASVAKSAGGIEKASVHMPEVARKNSMAVLMCNAVGPSDNFISYGSSAVWDKNGRCLAQLKCDTEALLIFDSQTSLTEVSPL